jgi:antitoxin component YwqK of YwqJK toxin-antitoxin module
MNLKILTIISLSAISAIAVSQTDASLNRTDPQGNKQGHWIKKYPNQVVMYDGFFKDNKPVGEFKRYYENSTILSVLIFNEAGTEAQATIYHPNGFVASKGKYINQKKEGKWQFFSAFINGYLICEEYYSGNMKNGLSVKMYTDSTVAEKINYINDVKQGEWTQYYPDGTICLKSTYLNGKINGKFEVWYENGKKQFSGQYVNETREGSWYIYNDEGTLKYKLEYTGGITNDRQLDIDESDYMDFLEKNKGKIADPEKTGIIK